MCLHSISDEKPKSNGTGWKVFRIEEGELVGPFTFSSGKPRKIGVFLEAVDDPNFSSFSLFNGKRNIGWHIFTTREAAEFLIEGLHERDDETSSPHRELVIREVEYKEAHTIGYGDGLSYPEKHLDSEVIVAKYMKILEEQ